MSLNTNSLSVQSTYQQYASISDAAQTGLDITGDMTMEGWFYYTTQSSNILISKHGSTFGYKLQLYNGSIYFGLSSTGSDYTEYGWLFTPVINTWYHTAFVYTASIGSVTPYINLVSQGTKTGYVTSIVNNTMPFEIGAVNGGYQFNGLIDEVRMWNVVRTSTEIANNYNVQLTGSETGLMGYWQLNNDYLDKTANGNTLTPINSPTFSTNVPFPGIPTPSAVHPSFLLNFLS